MAEVTAGRIHTRLSHVLLIVALAALLVADWLPRAADALRVVGIVALLTAPWLSLLAPGADRSSRWPWALGLLVLLAGAFLL